MHRGSWLGVVVICVVSMVLGVLGLHRLWTKGQRVKAILFLAAIVGYPIILGAVRDIEDKNIRLWMAMLVAAIAPIWLLSGFLTDDSTKRACSNHETSGMPARITGLVSLLVGILAWIYGATHPELPKGIGFVVVAVALYGCILGGFLTITGRR